MSGWYRNDIMADARTQFWYHHEEINLWVHKGIWTYFCDLVNCVSHFIARHTFCYIVRTKHQKMMKLGTLKDYYAVKISFIKIHCKPSFVKLFIFKWFQLCHTLLQSNKNVYFWYWIKLLLNYMTFFLNIRVFNKGIKQNAS